MENAPEGAKTTKKHYVAPPNKTFGVKTKGLSFENFFEQNPKESVSPQVGETKERIFRKTFEVIERPISTATEQASFTIESKSFRIRRGKTTVIRRCQEIMHMLWDMGHKHFAIVTPQFLQNAVFWCAGGDYRTAKRYIGFNKTMKKGKHKENVGHIPGYLERLHYAERMNNGKYRLNHEIVPLPYHHEQKQLVPPQTPLPNSNEASSSIVKMCVRKGVNGSNVEDHEGEALASIYNYNKQQHNTHTNRSSESILERLTAEDLAILRASKGEGG